MFHRDLDCEVGMLDSCFPSADLQTDSLPQFLHLSSGDSDEEHWCLEILEHMLAIFADEIFFKWSKLSQERVSRHCT